MSVGRPTLAQGGAQAASADRSSQSIRVIGLVRDEANAIPLPSVPVEVVGTKEVVYTDVDGRYILQLRPGQHQLKITVDGYQERLINLEVGAERTVTANIGLTMKGVTETVVVQGRAVDVQTSSAEAQLIERKQAPVITDNIGAQEMKANGDRDAASAMERVTGVSIVENSYVFVRGLGERYSNTTLAGSVLPTTEPDKKVVPLDLFPTGLIDSVQVNKSYSPDKSAEFAGGLVQIVPIKLPSQPVFDLTYGLGYFDNATGKGIPLSPLGSRDRAFTRPRLDSEPIRSPNTASCSKTSGNRPTRARGRVRVGARLSEIASTDWASSPASPSRTRNNSSRKIGGSTVSAMPILSRRPAITTC
jgi:hypothetical protein